MKGRSVMARSACIALGALLGACGNATMINGKVIQGDVSFVGAIDKSDERLSSIGLEGARVSLGTGGAQLSQVLSDAKGDFRASLGDYKATSGAVDFVVMRDGYATARGTLYVPPAAQRILVVLKPTGGTP